MQDNRPHPGRRPEPEREAQPALPNERLVYGKNPVAELLKSGAGVDTVLLAEGMAPAVASYYTALAKEAGAAVKRVHPNKLRQLAGTDSHQGVAAVASEIAYAEVDDLLAAARAKGEAPFLVISDGIEDPHNLGAVIRSALLCGAHGIIIPKRGGAQVTSTVLKASAGAAERLPVARVVNIAETVRRLLSTAPTWTAFRCAKTTSPAPSPWCWAARAAGCRSWSKSGATGCCGWRWPPPAPGWTASTFRWPPGSSCTRSRPSAPGTCKRINRLGGTDGCLKTPDAGT